MANPFVVSPLATFPLGPGQATDNLTALASGQAKGLGSLGTTLLQNYDDIVAPIQIKSGASGVSLSGTVTFYLVVSEDGSHWSGGVNPTSTSDQSALLTSLNSIVPALSVTANATVYTFREFSVYSLLGFMPTFWSIIVYNQSGAAFDATAANFIAQHSLVSYA